MKARARFDDDSGLEGIRVGMIDIEQDLTKLTGFGADVPELGQMVARFETSPMSIMRNANRIWAHRLVSPTSRLLALAKDLDDSDADKPRLQLVALVTLVFAVLAVITWLVMLGRWPLYLSIRVKLLALFLYMVGLPLTAMSINAFNFLAERRTGLENQVHMGMESALHLFDQRFPIGVGEMQQQMLQTLGVVQATGTEMLEATRERLRWLQKTMRPSVLQLFDQRGRQLFNDTDRAERSSVLSFSDVKVIYVNLLRCLNGQPVDNSELGGGAGGFAEGSGKAGFDLGVIMSDIARGLNKLTEFKIGENRSLQGLIPLLDGAGIARFLAVVGWSRNRIEHFYTLRYLGLAQKRLEDTRLFAWNRGRESRSVPARSRWRRPLGDFLEKLAAQTQTMRGRIVRGDVTWLLTGVRCRELGDYCLVAITADHSLRREIGGLRRQYTVMSLAMILIGLSVANLLARKFVEPVGHLTLGVAALQDRRFDRRIAVLDRDELGDLSTTFNAMMEGMADLEVGRIVQESLFPQTAATIDALSVYGSCLPASQMGGDYYDYFPIGGNRVALLIGDVSGHGVASAMVMAMAKAIVAHMSESEIDPARVLAALNTVILRNLKRSRMMSCFFAIIDPATGKMSWCNAGHNYPYVVRDQGIETLEMRNYPLGMSARPKFANAETALRPGDVVLFYTDGLIEALGRNGEQIGYERLLADLPGMRRATPVDTEAAIREWHRQLAQPGPQADDITVVVVQWQAPGPAEATT